MNSVGTSAALHLLGFRMQVCVCVLIHKVLLVSEIMVSEFSLSDVVWYYASCLPGLAIGIFYCYPTLLQLPEKLASFLNKK